MRVSRLALVLGVLALASTTWAQDAVEWFGKAVYTTNSDEQIYYYRKALEADPSYHQAAHNLAGVYYRKGHVRKSIALYEHLIRNARAYHQTFYNLACCYARVGDNQHALKALTRAFQKGFQDKKLLERDEDLAEIRSTSQYAQLYARYLGGKHRPAQEFEPARQIARRTPRKPRNAPAVSKSTAAVEPVQASVVVKK